MVQKLDHEISWNKDEQGNITADLRILSEDVGMVSVVALFEEADGTVVEEKHLVPVLGRPSAKIQIPPEISSAGLITGRKTRLPVLLEHATTQDFKVALNYAKSENDLKVEVLTDEDGGVYVEFTPDLVGEVLLKLELVGRAAELAGGKSEYKAVNLKVRPPPSVNFTSTQEAILDFPATCVLIVFLTPTPTTLPLPLPLPFLLVLFPFSSYRFSHPCLAPRRRMHLSIFSA
jgi:hypothetical protein